MRRSLAVTAAAAAAVGLVLLVAAAVLPLPTEAILDGYVLAVGALLLLALVRATAAGAPRSGPSAYEQALRRRPSSDRRPQDLERLEREVVLAGTTAFDAHLRVRPVLREIASHRLEARHGVELDRSPATGERLLGGELWELVRPDRDPPEDRFAPGLPLARLAAHVDALERL